VTEDESRSLIVEALHRTANVFNNPSISARLRDQNADIAIDELGLDSLDRVEWCIAIEARTGLDVEPGKLAQCATLGEFARLVAKQAVVRAD
jgi:acyl carrier protein